MAPHSSTLAWKIPWTEEPGGLQSMGSLGVRHDWATSLSLFTFMHWRRQWQTTPVFLPGESQGRGAWWAAVSGVAQSWTRLKRLSSSYSSSPEHYTPRCYLIAFCSWVISGFKQYLLWEVSWPSQIECLLLDFIFFSCCIYHSMPFGFIMGVPCFLTRMSSHEKDSGPALSHSPIMYHQHFLKVLCKKYYYFPFIHFQSVKFGRRRWTCS